MPNLPTFGSARRMKLWSGKADKKSTHSRAGSQEHIPQDGDGESQVSAEQIGIEKADEENRPLAMGLKARRIANEVLYSAAEGFHASLVKKKQMPFTFSNADAVQTAMALDEASDVAVLVYPASSPVIARCAKDWSGQVKGSKDRLLPAEVLGLAMASVSATYKQKESPEELSLQPVEAFASHLTHLAAMHLALAEAQTAFTDRVSTCLLDRLARQQASLDSLRTAEKACQSAREAMATTEKKREKARDKGGRRRELEEEARSARATYEDAQNDVKVRLMLLTETEQTGTNSGVSMVKDYVNAYVCWAAAQMSIVQGVQTAFEHFEGGPSSAVTSTGHSKSVVQPPPRMRMASTPLPPSEIGAVPTQSKETKTKRPSLVTRISNSSSRHSIDVRPPSRGSFFESRRQDKNSNGRHALRSDSFSGPARPEISPSKERNDESSRSSLQGDSLSKASKLGSRISHALSRSMSSTEEKKVTTSAPLLQKQDSSSSSEGKVSHWSSSLVPLRRDAGARSYKAIDSTAAAYHPAAAASNGIHERDLSHVREGTDEIDDGAVFLTSARVGAPGAEVSESVIVRPVSHYDQFADEVGMTPHKPELSFLSPPNSALGPQWTGHSVASSDGGDPFGGGGSSDMISHDFVRSYSPRVEATPR